MTKDEAPTSPKDAALTLALEALENGMKFVWTDPEREAGFVAIDAIREALAQPERTGWPAGLLQDDDRKLSKWLASKPDAKHVVNMAQPEHRALQLKGEHPAPCIRHCEANAFQSVIKNLQVQQQQDARRLQIAMRQWEESKTYALELQKKLVKYEGGSPMILNTQPEEQQSCDKQEPVGFAVMERPWVGLTDEDFQAICKDFRITHGGWVDMLVAQVEAKLKEKNA